uniref:G-protein coupled receptors family 1 profile domain-containing protein n=1 Tax=Sander lucioperca TaxID=283035 RepID=A0A8C9YGU3_SANLU
MLTLKCSVHRWRKCNHNYRLFIIYDEDIPDFAPCSNANLKDFGMVFLPTLYSMVFILGFLGNGLVVCVLVKHRNQTNLTDICLFNLALSDLLFVLTLPFYSHYSMVGQWTFGDFMCRFTSGSHNTGFFSSIFFMIVMTLDRYVVIMHTQKVARYRTVRLGIAMTVFVWMLSLCVSLPVIIFTKVTNDSQQQACSYVPNDAWKSYHTLTINVLGLMIPLLVMIVCYSRIIPILVNMRSAKKHRVLPNNCNMESNLGLSVTVTETFAYTHCCLNPIIYAFVGQKFMKRALQLLRKWMPGILLPSNRDLSDSSYRKSSNMPDV